MSAAIETNTICQCGEGWLHRRDGDPIWFCLLCDYTVEMWA